MSDRKLRWRTVITPIVVAMAVIVSAPPAQAHGTSISRSWGHGGVTDSHMYVYACDDRGDNAGVYTVYVAAAHPRYVVDSVHSPEDRLGCRQEESVAGPIVNYKLCRDIPRKPDVCTGWNGGT